MTDLIIVFCKKGIHILSSKKKVDFLKTIESSKENEEGVPPVTLLVRDKSDKDSANFDNLLNAISKSGNGKVIGEFSRDTFQGEFVQDWKQKFDAKKLDQVDVSVAFAYIMSPKDETEINIISKASTLSCDLYAKYLKEEITEIIDSDKKVRHMKLADGVEAASNNKKYIKNVDMSQVELCYPPIIQSGGNYNLKFSAVSDKSNIHFGAIICAMGVRYKQYCSNIVRTLLVNPTEEQKNLYEFLLVVEDAILDALRPGVPLSKVYQVALDKVAKHDRKLVDKFTKNCGFSMGIEFREASLQIAPKSSSTARKGMIFNVSLGFSNLENKEASDNESKVYALFIGDTVLVNDENTPASILTLSKKKLKSIAIIIKDEDEEDEEEEVEEKKDNGIDEALLSRGRRTAVIDNKLRVSHIFFLGKPLLIYSFSLKLQPKTSVRSIRRSWLDHWMKWRELGWRWKRETKPRKRLASQMYPIEINHKYHMSGRFPN